MTVATCSGMRGLPERLGSLRSEPAVFVYCFAIGIYGAVIPNLVQQKVCSPDIEPSFDYVCRDARYLEQATNIITTRSTIREMLPIAILLLAGSWRDSTGLNKPMMYLALVGEIIGVSVELFASWKWKTSAWLTSVTDSTLYGLLGGSKLFYVGATCVITDHSTPEDRTTRLAIYQASATIGSCLSIGLSGFCLQYMGYIWFFTMVILLHVLAIIMVIPIKEKKKLSMEKRSPAIIKIKSIFRTRPNNIIIWMMLISCCLINVIASAEDTLNLYFLQQGFGFSVTGVGIYVAFRHIVSALSSAVFPPIINNLLVWSDFTIGIAASTCAVVTGIMMAFAKNVLELITIAMLDFMKIFITTVPMSIVTKCVNSDEVGVFVSLRFIGECIFPAAIFYAYREIFSMTYQTMPGAFYLASAGAALVILVIFSASSILHVSPENLTSEKDKEGCRDEEKCQAKYSGDCQLTKTDRVDTITAYKIPISM